MAGFEIRFNTGSSFVNIVKEGKSRGVKGKYASQTLTMLSVVHIDMGQGNTGLIDGVWHD